MNREIELHDSEIEAIEFDETDLCLLFCHAYVHKSIGRPGIDRGIGVSQRAVLRIMQAEWSAIDLDWPLTISTGELRLGERVYHMVPVDIAHNGPTTLMLCGCDGEGAYYELVVSGSGVQLEVDPNETYIEDVEPF